MITGRSAAASSAAASSTPAAAEPAAGRDGGGILDLGLAEDDVQRVVEEGRAARRGSIARSSAAAVIAAIASVSFAVSADLTSGETKGRWSISCSEPEPQRISGARPPSTQIGELFAWAAGDRAHPVGHPRPGGQRRDRRARGSPSRTPRRQRRRICSWRTSTIPIPSLRSRHRSRTGGPRTA